MSLSLSLSLSLFFFLFSSSIFFLIKGSFVEESENDKTQNTSLLRSRIRHSFLVVLRRAPFSFRFRLLFERERKKEDSAVLSFFRGPTKKAKAFRGKKRGDDLNRIRLVSSSSSSSSSALEFCLGKTQNHSLEVSKDLLFCLRRRTEKKRVPFCPFLSRRLGPF